eukprot:750403-Hanusia_phi.AAC.2
MSELRPIPREDSAGLSSKRSGSYPEATPLQRPRLTVRTPRPGQGSCMFRPSSDEFARRITQPYMALLTDNNILLLLFSLKISRNPSLPVVNEWKFSALLRQILISSSVPTNPLLPLIWFLPDPHRPLPPPTPSSSSLPSLPVPSFPRHLLGSLHPSSARPSNPNNDPRDEETRQLEFVDYSMRPWRWKEAEGGREKEGGGGRTRRRIEDDGGIAQVERMREFADYTQEVD